MKTLFFTLIVAVVAITGIILTALFGTTDVQESVIPALVIAAVGFPLLYRYAEKQSEENPQTSENMNGTTGRFKKTAPDSLRPQNILEKNAA